MSPAVLGVLKVLGIALVAILIAGFAIATGSWKSALVFVGWLGFGVLVLRASVKRT